MPEVREMVSDGGGFVPGAIVVGGFASYPPHPFLVLIQEKGAKENQAPTGGGEVCRVQEGAGVVFSEVCRVREGAGVVFSEVGWIWVVAYAVFSDEGWVRARASVVFSGGGG